VASPEPQTTTATWDLFERYNVATRGRNDVPPRFLKNAIWRDHQGRLGYYAESTLSLQAIVPVEFNEPHLCWVELRWRAHKDQWQAFRKAPEDLGLEIPITELTAQEVIQILGQDSPEPSERDYRDGRLDQTPETTPIHDSSMSEALEPTQIYTEETPDDRDMRDQAESLHIFDQGVQSFMDAPRITTDRIGDTLYVFTTRTEESRTQTAHIDPNTGHVIDPDEVAAHHAAGPD
jgi:Uma2 family endonuclease